MLKNCPECKREISSEAKSCPHCGKPIKENQFWNFWTGCGTTILVIIGLISILLVIISFIVVE